MRSVVLDDFDVPPTVRDDLPTPEVGDDRVLVRVHASSVNPVDAAIAGGMLRDMAEHVFPVTLGRDFAGVVEAAGGAVTRYAAGDEVFGYVMHADPAVHDGSWAELAAVPQDGFIAPKPAGVDFREAGVAPLAAVSALASLDALEVGEGDTLLIVGATGGVGSFAVQLAAQAGATVIAPALPEDEEYLRGLGVTELVERGGDVAAAVRERYSDGVDALLELVSYTPDGFDAYAAALKDGGRGASTVGAAGDAPGRFNIMGSSDAAQMDRLRELLEEGRLRVPIQRTYPLEEAGEALAALGSEHTVGKLAIAIA